MKTQLQGILQRAVRKAAHQGRWGDMGEFVPEIERPKERSHGDFACNAALVLAPRLKRSPREIAELIRGCLEDEPGLIAASEIAGPGFINLRLREDAWQRALGSMEDPHFVRPDLGGGRRVLIEYVSANPTGPLHVGNARGGPLGDSLARILSQCGYEVMTEYYVNDIGGQVDRLGQSILHWMKEAAGIGTELPEGGYFGDYVKELAREATQHPERDYLAMPEEEAVALLAEWGVRRLLEEIRSDCEAMGSTFDRWVHEKELRNHVDGVIDRLTEAGATKEAEGALWFVPKKASRGRSPWRPGIDDEGGRARGPAPTEDSSTINDRDSVLRRSNGEPTYFADDLVCHGRRFDENFDRIIDIWGANHHGHVPRIKAALQALAYDVTRLEIVLYQYVRVCRGSEAVKMSKRAGDYVTAREVLEEVGADAMRFFLLQRAPSAHLDFDLELAKKQSSENPIYYIQYAHARICSVERKAGQHGLENAEFNDIDPTLLDLPEEIQLIQQLFEYPEAITMAATRLEPHHIAYYLLDLARLFHNYYTKGNTDDRYRVVSVHIDRSQAKLYLLRVIKAVLADGLELLNLTAPEEMRIPVEEGEASRA